MHINGTHPASLLLKCTYFHYQRKITVMKKSVGGIDRFIGRILWDILQIPIN